EFVNKEYVALNQYTLEALKGKKPRIFNPGHLSSAHYETMWKTLCYGQIWKGEYINRRKDHTEFQVEVIISAIQHADGSISNFVIVMDDVTEKKRMINELIIAKDRAEESERLKSAFLANMSHEIRTPMNGILGFAELLKEPDLTGEEQQQYIAIIEESGARMLNIINDIISISKIESGLMKVNIQPSNINDQIEFIYTFFKPEVERKGMTLSCTYTLPSEKSILLTDKEKVYAILINLVKNAIKYSEKGSIDFGYTKKGDFLEFYVKDTGMGIPKERQEAIFERFIQADITDQSALQGAGLGLSIAKAYIEMLGGDLWVESEVGKGSTFYFTLPYPTEK
ncbi:MAG: PAS domain-containing sensor histidine kinase, partial [Bacteroidales bacterium]|nr:PAS domain-containing sensor histidine kinase [Bacteroidales bacterium]